MQIVPKACEYNNQKIWIRLWDFSSGVPESVEYLHFIAGFLIILLRTSFSHQR